GQHRPHQHEQIGHELRDETSGSFGVPAHRPVLPGAGPQSRPSFVPAYTASARRDTISLRIRFPTWNFTVVSEMNSSAPIARFDSPRAKSRSTSSSRSVSPSRSGTPPESDRTIAEAL